MLSGVSQWIWNTTNTVTVDLLRHVVFYPMPWPSVEGQFYVLSRNIAWSIGIVLILWALIRGMWPELSLSHLYPSPPVVIHRVVTAMLLSLVSLYLVRSLLSINNAVVSRLMTNRPMLIAHASSFFTVLSPLVAVVMAMLLLGLIVYLGLFYALRTIEILLLTAILPWIYVWWIQSADDTLLRNVSREIIVAVFVQSLHAGAFWLYFHLMSEEPSALTPFEAAGVLWYMTKLPDQLRRIVGIGFRGPFWQWR